VDWISKHPAIGDVAEICQPAGAVGGVLGDLEHVHLLVVAEESVEAGEMGANEGRDVVEELWPQITFRRESQVLVPHFQVVLTPPPGYREARIPLSVPPSTAATSREYAKLQKNSKTAMYDGFYAEKRGHPTVITVAPPIQLFHPVFQEFLDRIDDPKFEPDEASLFFASALLPTASEIPPSEEVALYKLRPLLSSLLDRVVGTVVSGKRIPDGMTLKSITPHRIPLITLEYKRAFGEGGCDPSTQAAFSVREFLSSKEVRDFHAFSHLH